MPQNLGSSVGDDVSVDQLINDSTLNLNSDKTGYEKFQGKNMVLGFWKQYDVLKLLKKNAIVIFGTFLNSNRSLTLADYKYEYFGM